MSKDRTESPKPAAKNESEPPSLLIDADGLLREQADASDAEGTKAFAMDTAPPPGNEATEHFDGDAPPSAPRDQTQALDESNLSAEAKKIAAKPGPAPKTSQIGDYKLLKKLGQGGMGAVFKAHQISLDRPAAVKVLSKELAGKPSFVQRFVREARVMAKLDHPNILRCFEVGEAMGHHYIAMEYVEGGSVEDWVKKLGKLNVGDALHIIMAVARALEHAHDLGMIHRDVKPDNVLLTKKGVVKLADLGLAKAMDDDLGLTKTGTGAGTPLYMAPEQARDVKHVDARCDIYALGVMLYVFLTGLPPFSGTTLVEVIEAKEKGKFKPIRTTNADVPERLDLIVDKMLAKDVKHRYATCAEVIAELEALGLAADGLSFFGAAAASAKPAPARAPASPTKAKATPPAAATAQPRTVAPTRMPASDEPKIEANIWYWKFNDPKGRTITKKLTLEEVSTLIQSGSIDATAQLSRLPTTGYRAAAAFSDFETFFRGKLAEKKAGKGADKYKSMLDQITQEDARKRRWKWLRKFGGKFGSAVGLIVWLAVLAGAIAGGYFGVMWLLARMR